MWETITGTLTGPQHLKRGKGSQDTLAHYSEGDTSIIVACDGAGSHEHSLQGAELVAQHMVEQLQSALLEVGVSEEAMATALEESHTLLRSQENYRSMGCTVAAVACQGDQWVAGVVGDAFAVIHGDDGSHLLVQPQREAEYANVTELMSGSKIHPHIVAGDNVRVASVSTDGLLHRAIGREGPTENFWSPLLARFSRGELDLQALLEYMESKELLDDDTTIVMTRKQD